MWWRWQRLLVEKRGNLFCLRGWGGVQYLHMSLILLLAEPKKYGWILLNLSTTKYFAAPSVSALQHTLFCTAPSCPSFPQICVPSQIPGARNNNWQFVLQKVKKKLPDLASDLRSFPASWCKKQLTVCFTKSRKKLPDLASDLRSFPYSWRKKQQWTVCFTKSKKGCQTLGLAAAFDAAVLEAGCPGADITAWCTQPCFI